MQDARNFPPARHAHTNDWTADEVRRSGRANKGHHTKNADALDEVIAKPKPKGKPDKKTPTQSEPARSQSVQSAEPQQDEEEEEDAIYRCVCGDQREIRGREMIMCDRCEAWQHNRCLGLPDSSYWEDKTYLCEKCKPEDHTELLAAIARGEKPWNRKKGSKAAKPKFRPSDVGSVEATPEKKDTETPQPVPAPVPSEEHHEPSNGHVDAKVSIRLHLFGTIETDLAFQPTKKTPPKNQAPSPGEKRPHEAISEKDATSTKRRKPSAQHHQKAGPQAPAVGDPTTLPEKQRAFVEKLVTSLVASIKDASKSRGYQVPDGATPVSIATDLALQIDHAAAEHFGAPTQNSGPYPERFRAILSNTKKNVILVDRLLSGSLSGADIATMPIEEMASEDKQKEFAVLKEKAEKQMVLTEETGPRLRKTHKGEEIVGEDTTTIEHDYKPPDQRTRESIDEGRPPGQQSPTTDGAQVELPEDVTRRPLAVDTSGAQAPSDSVRRPSTTFDINSVFDKVRSPQQDQQAFLHRRQSSIRAQQTPQENAVVDADIDRLLKDEDNDVEMSGYSADPTVVWRGAIDMQSFGPFEAVARFVAGGDFGQVVPWDQLLSPSLPILGRIESAKGNDYIEGLAISGSHDVGVLAITPVTPEGQHIFDQLFSYFHPRDRWGVVPVDKLHNDAMRDLYVIPIQPGGSELPQFLNMLEYCTIETPRPQPLILLALVAKLPEQKPQVPPTQHFEQYPTANIAAGQVAPPIPPPVNGGPSPSPATNPHGPSYSPVQPSFPPGQQNFGGQYPPPAQGHNGFPQVPPHHRNPKALEIFGPYIEAPVIVQLLTANPDMTDVQMGNLRHIVDNVPAARTDLGVLQSHLIKGREAQQ
jgi:hypothetical protein